MVPWDDFVQRVRRHRPSELLQAIAIANIGIAPGGMWDPTVSRHLYPWSLAVAARESLRVGNEHRDPGITGLDLVQITHKHHNLYDPLVDDNDALAFLIRIAYEQFPFQEPLFYGLSRSRLLFERASPEARAKLRLVVGDFWERSLGLPLDTLFVSGFLFGIGATENHGLFDLDWYRQPNFAPISVVMSEADAEAAMVTLYGATRDELRDLCSTYKPGYERVAFNPLQARPFVLTRGRRFLAPVPQFVLWRASAPALYYIALEKLPDADKRTFTDDVGTLFEDYVVRQARQLPIESVDPEIEYSGGKTTDAILVWPDFILVVEAKATRLSQESRMGGATLRGELDRTLGRALEQIEQTAKLIKDREPAVAHIPSDRPIDGLVVTLEPYYVPELAREFEGRYPSKLPVAVTSIGEFERFVADAMAEPLTRTEMETLVSDNRMAWQIRELIGRRNHELNRNPLMDDEYLELTGFFDIGRLANPTGG